MDVSLETLRKAIGELPDDELLKRWELRLFTDEALKVAEAEIEKRGLDTSAANLEHIHLEEFASRQAFRSRNWRKARRILFFLLMSIISVIGGTIVALVLKG